MKCKVEGCNQIHAAKGYCSNHYQQLKRYGAIGKGTPQPHRISHKVCKIADCELKYYAKGYCRKHYGKYVSHVQRIHLDNICSVENCNKRIPTTETLCANHKAKLNRRIKHNLSVDLSIDGRVLSKTGINNPRWNSGISDYVNHSEMKKIRKVKLESVNHKCEICGKEAKEIHHIDGTKYNHNIYNLIAVCHKCHRTKFHNHKPTTSKFIRLYGNTARDIAVMINKSLSYVHILHHKNKLIELLKKPISKATPDPHRPDSLQPMLSGR
jgi:hypothetical protein